MFLCIWVDWPWFNFPWINTNQHISCADIELSCRVSLANYSKMPNMSVKSLITHCDSIIKNWMLEKWPALLVLCCCVKGAMVGDSWVHTCGVFSLLRTFPRKRSCGLQWGDREDRELWSKTWLSSGSEWRQMAGHFLHLSFIRKSRHKV